MQHTSFLSFNKDGSTAICDKVTLSGAGSGLIINSPEEYTDLQARFSKLLKDNPDAALAFGKEEDDESFVKVPFRLLSATIVGAGSWKATDFTDEKMLEKSVNLLKDKPVYKDHSTYTVGNAIGKVFNPIWQNSFTDSEGNRVPAGVNGLVGVDKEIDSKMARNILTGAVSSNSVTVAFDWEPSHDFGDDDDAEWKFRRNLGTIIDGKMVTRKVTGIRDYFETSLVFLGADPYAKKLKENGDLHNIDSSSVFEDEDDTVQTTYKKDNSFSLTETPTPATKFFKDNTEFFDCFKLKKDEMKKYEIELRQLLGLDESVEITAEHILSLQLKSTDQLMNVTDFVKAGLKVEEVDLTKLEELAVVTSKKDFSDLVAIAESSTKLKEELVAKEVDITSLQTEKKAVDETLVENRAENLILIKRSEDAEAKNIELTTELTSKTELAKIGETYISNKKEEAIRLYKLAVGEKADEAFISLINKANDSEIEGLLKQYVSTATEKFSGVCKKCGSAEFNFKSSFSDTDIKETTHNANSIAAIESQLTGVNPLIPKA